MKNPIIIATLFLSLTSTHAVDPQKFGAPKELEIGLSPYYRPTDITQIREAIVRLAFEVPAGSRLSIHDAYNLKTICQITLPKREEVASDTPAQRNRFIVTPLSALMSWFKEQQTANIPSLELKGSAAVRAPEWLDQVATPQDRPRSVILIGSPFYMSSAEPSFSMTDLRVPSDGHYFVGLRESPYGTADKQNQLGARSVHWCYLNENVWGNSYHKTLVTRFWNIFVTRQAGKMSAFSADLREVLGSALKPTAVSPTPYEADANDRKVEMRVATARTISASPASPASTNSSIGGTNAVPIPETGKQSSAKPESVPLIPITLAPDTALAIGIMWPTHCDLDLYVRSRRTGEELSFQKTRINGGYYHHDFQDANARGTPGKLDYEFAELKAPIEIEDAEAWINYYAGVVAKPSGQVVVWYRGQQYVSNFSLPSASGNLAIDSLFRRTSSHWIEIKLKEITAAR